MITIRENITGYELIEGDKTLVTSIFPIEEVHVGSSNYIVWKDSKSFVIYNVLKRSFLYGDNQDRARSFQQITYYSEEYKSFVAAYYSSRLDRTLYNIIREDRTCNVNFYQVGPDLGGYRIVLERVLNEVEYWNYCSENGFQLQFYNSFNGKLGPMAHGIPCFFDQYKKKFVLFYRKYNRHRNSNSMIFLNYINADKFIEIPDTNFFVGEDFLRPSNETKSRYRLFHVHVNHNHDKKIIGSDEYFIGYEYLADLCCFKVETLDGWKLMRYNSSIREFEYLPFLGSYKTMNLKVIDSYVFVENVRHSWDFVSLTNDCNSSLWQSVEFVDGLGNQIQLTDLYGEKKVVLITELYNVYNDMKQYVQKQTELRVANAASNCTTIKASSFSVLSEQELSEERLDFCCTYAGRIIDSGHVVYTTNKIYGTISEGAQIAWINFSKHILYVVRAEPCHAYRIIGKMELTEQDWDLLSGLELPKIKELNDDCTVANFLDCLRREDEKEKENEKQKKDEDENEKDWVKDDNNLPALDLNKEHNSQPDFADIIKSTYEYLSKVANSQKVMESLFILFSEDIQKLRGYNDKVDSLLKTLPYDDLYKSLTTDVVESATVSLPESQRVRFQTSFNYHLSFTQGGLREQLSAALNDCKSFANLIRQNIEGILQEENERRSLNSKETVMRILFYIIAQIKTSEEPKTKVKLQMILDNAVLDLHLNQQFDRSFFSNVNKDYVRKAESVLIFLDKDDLSRSLDSDGYYELLGEGRDQHVSQTIGQNANGDIASGTKKIYLFQKVTAQRCMFYDQVQYVGHDEINDRLAKNRTVIMFRLKSLLRYK